NDIVDFYRKDGPKIFSSPRGLARYVRGSKYSNSKLNEIVKAYFGSMKISQALVDVLVTTYDIRNPDPYYISRQRAKADSQHDYLMHEAAMATSAAPTYFPPFSMNERTLIDGGLAANNPACLAFAEAKQLWPEEDVLLVSLGTGRLTRSVHHTKA